MASVIARHYRFHDYVLLVNVRNVLRNVILKLSYGELNVEWYRSILLEGTPGCAWRRQLLSGLAADTRGLLMRPRLVSAIRSPVPDLLAPRLHDYSYCTVLLLFNVDPLYCFVICYVLLNRPPRLI